MKYGGSNVKGATTHSHVKVSFLSREFFEDIKKKLLVIGIF
jgi:hypothetical protein